MTFVDASVIVAIMTGEDDAAMLLAALEEASAPFTTAIAVFEATLGVFRKHRRPLEAVEEQVMQFLLRAGITVVPISPEEAGLALSAFARFGKGQGHPAQLNMGDCFAYAAARQRGAALLCKGDDFPQTDIRLS
jgi:ribonuclease VapC